MSSVWTKARKNTPEIDCGLCGLPTCATFARSLVTEKIEIVKCPILSLETFSDKREKLVNVEKTSKRITKPAPEQPEGGVLLSKPCLDAPELLMAEMRIFNGVKPGLPQVYGVLDPVILCWLLDCVSSRYQDMRCSKDLAYAWGDMEEIKVHILRDGRVRMRRAKGRDHALESFRIIERTVIGAAICNCCGHDLFSILMDLAPQSSEKRHPVLEAGSTLTIDYKQLDWKVSNPSMDDDLKVKMKELLEPIHTSLTSQLDTMVSGDFKSENPFDARPQICKFISLMLEPAAQEYVTMFLKGLAISFFLDNALQGLVEIRKLVNEKRLDTETIIDLLRQAQGNSLELNKESLKDDTSILLLGNTARVSRGLTLYKDWI
ncbi:MAG: (Fe-S)-binding protein [Candidatus Thorarchaeota archaeon]